MSINKRRRAPAASRLTSGNKAIKPLTNIDISNTVGHIDNKMHKQTNKLSIFVNVIK